MAKLFGHLHGCAFEILSLQETIAIMIMSPKTASEPAFEEVFCLGHVHVRSIVMHESSIQEDARDLPKGADSFCDCLYGSFGLGGVFMATDLQVKKFSYVFHWIDQNGDGWITQDDFEKMAHLFTTVADAEDQKNKSAMKKGFMHFWNLLLEGRADKTSEKIGKQEFIRIMDAVVIAPKNFEAAVIGIVDGLLGALDRDGNGSLSREEYVRMYDALGVSPATSSEAFGRLDRDGDGEISHAEFHQAIVEYYLSADPNAPGNWLLGPMDALK